MVARLDLLDELRGALPGMRLLTEAAETAPFGRDETRFIEAGEPLAVAFPRSTAEVSPLVRHCARHGVPIVPRGAGTGLSGGAIAVRGRHQRGHDRDGAHPRDRRGRAARGLPARRHQRRTRRRGGGRGALLPARPGLLRDLLDRRQPGRERRRPALPEVRHHARLRPGPRGRAGRRRGHPHRGPQRQGRHGLRPDAPVRRARRARSASSPRRPCACCRSQRPG